MVSRLLSFCRRHLAEWAACLSVLAVLAVAAMFTGRWLIDKNGYPSFALQANAWLQGRLDLGQDYPWLELAVFQGDWYVSFPPVPTIPVYLLTFIFGENVPDNLLVKLYALAGMLASFGALRTAGWKAAPAA